jgi:protoporphyrinogen oxidase
MRIGIVGGGISGLASAHYLLKAGYSPVVLEAADVVGGLQEPFIHGGVAIDPSPQLLLDNDTALIGLMAELEGLGRIVWRKTHNSYISGGVQYSFDSPTDLLRFRALSLLQRLRTGLGTLRATQLQRFGLDLDTVPVREWLVSLFGIAAWERIWEPYLRSRFGEAGEHVPAYWVWERLNREKNGRQDMKGYPRGGLRWVIDQLRASIEARGADVRVRTRVSGVEVEEGGVTVDLEGGVEHFDALISTLRIPSLLKIARGPLAAQIPNPDLSYQSAINAVVLSREPLERFYWTVVGDDEAPFSGVCEMTHVIPTEWTGGYHVTYLTRYCDARSQTFRDTDAAIGQRARDFLASYFPDFDASAIAAVYVSRAADVQPVWTLGYLERRPRPRIGETPVYLCSDEQAYPRILTTWSNGITLARETVYKLRGDYR